MLMHGADANAAATHDSGPAVAHEHHDADRASTPDTVHWHHVALACIAVLTAAVVIARRGHRSIDRVTTHPTGGPRSRWSPAGPSVLATGPPRWLDLAVIRR